MKKAVKVIAAAVAFAIAFAAQAATEKVGDYTWTYTLKDGKATIFNDAKNVLRRVLGFYAENPHNFGRIRIASMKRGAEDAAKAMSSGNIEAFAKCVNDYWRDKKLLDAGSTNEKRGSHPFPIRVSTILTLIQRAFVLSSFDSNRRGIAHGPSEIAIRELS